MTQEEKAKAYDEALKVLHKYDGANIMFTQDLKEEMFPELKESKESEDEMIRKALIKYYSFDKDGGSHALDNITPKQIVAWLEKLKDEKKPDDKVEPKFKVGDWIVGANSVLKIISLNDELNCYIAVTPNNEEVKIPYYFDDGKEHMCSYHLWTIQDAKDGDVLSYRDGQWIFIYKGFGKKENEIAYYALLSDEGLTLNNYNYSVIESAFSPATKEQRDTLMKAMADEGYTFDFEKKELKKIEQKHAEWSEEDENAMWLLKDIVRHSNKINEKIYTMALKEKLYDWLKSLRPQSQWKPSDEQMIALRQVISGCSYDIEPLLELETKLKEFYLGTDIF